MWHRLQPFGYATPEQSLLHDTAQVLRNTAVFFELVPPSISSNQDERHYLRDLAAIFAAAYREKYRREQLSPLTEARIAAEVQEYRTSGILPYYVMRVWFSRTFGEEVAALCLKRGTTPL